MAIRSRGRTNRKTKSASRYHGESFPMTSFGFYQRQRHGQGRRMSTGARRVVELIWIVQGKGLLIDRSHSSSCLGLLQARPRPKCSANTWRALIRDLIARSHDKLIGASLGIHRNFYSRSRCGYCSACSRCRADSQGDQLTNQLDYGLRD